MAVSSDYRGILAAQFRLLEEVELFFKRLRGPLRRVSAPPTPAEFVLLAETGDELSETFSISRREERSILITASIVLHQMRKVLLEEWQKDGCGARLQKKWIGEDVVRSRLGGRTD